MQPKRTQAAVFVAASAHQIIARETDDRTDGPTVLSSNTVSCSISSTLLFLIADRAADAAEAASRLTAIGEDHAIRRVSLISIRELAKGELSKISERVLEEEWISADDSRRQATNVLFRECAYVVRGLAVETKRRRIGMRIAASKVPGAALRFGHSGPLQTSCPLNIARYSPSEFLAVLAKHQSLQRSAE